MMARLRGADRHLIPHLYAWTADHAAERIRLLGADDQEHVS